MLKNEQKETESPQQFFFCNCGLTLKAEIVMIIEVPRIEVVNTALDNTKEKKKKFIKAILKKVAY